MTKGQIESKISEAISKFEIEQMGRGIIVKTTGLSLRLTGLVPSLGC